MRQISRVYQTFRPFRREQLFLIGLIIINILLTAYIPLQIRNLINAITEGKSWQIVFNSGLTILAVTVLNMCLDLFKNYRWHRLRYQAINFLRLEMFASALRKPVEYFQKHSVGEIIARTIDDVTDVAQQGVIGPSMLFGNLFQLVVAMGLLFFLQYKLAIIVLVFIPTYYLLFTSINPKLQKSSAMERVHYSNVMKDAQEKLLGIRTIKIFQREQYMANNFSKVLDQHLFYISKNLLYYFVGQGITGLMVSVLPVVILLYGGFLVLQQEISLGALIAFYTYLGYLYEPIKNLSDYHLMLQSTLGMCDRVLSFLDPEDEEAAGTIRMKEFQSLIFDNVSFAYETGKPILSNINFSIQQGDRVAIIGQSGSGKSTLLNLIMKMYHPQSGRILCNQTQLEQIHKNSLYSHLTLLEQSHFLFDGTLQENITFGDAIEADKVHHVANLANLTRLIETSPEGLSRRITELGLNLSGGERQRICLARALIHEADLVLLDEATSSLDTSIENEIVNNLQDYLQGKTLIAVSHRPAILSICTKVLHLEQGRLIRCYDLTQAADHAEVLQLISQAG